MYIKQPITMPRWRFLMCMIVAFVTGGFAFPRFSFAELAAVLLLAFAIDYGSQRRMRNN